MKQFDLLIIGFGKGGKTLAKFAAGQGKSVAVVEKSKKMYGGTCINIGCIPSKTLVHEGLEHGSFDEAFSRKSDVVNALNSKNYHNLADDNNISVLDYKAVFTSNKEIDLLDEDDQIQETITATDIVINTGANPVIPSIDGVETSQHLYDSTGIMALTTQPKQLVIVGGGYIALEFASMFANFGTQVTILEKHDDIMPKEDKEIVSEVKKDLENKGVNLVLNADTERFEDTTSGTIVHTTKGNYEADAVLLATGRKPNVDFGLENTDIKIGERGEIKVDKHLQTDVPHIYALGDVKGGMQFTYISLDDFRIVKDQLFGKGERTTENRGVVPYTVFIDPPLSRVGLTAGEAKTQGYQILENAVPVNTIPRHKVNNDTRGLFKSVVNKETNEILGATLYGLQSEEIINLIKLAIDQRLPFEVLKENIYTHPTMAESFNDLFNM
ncbi:MULTISPECIES: hypothiocyanous acid reductase MerA [Staphylococcus]|jgi:pyruvate/2-oxoglutarate dehydrogenase complex dihydrolipoamide dehydrogenase (E3) component|uniref:hypothiocyanous acid reductase MerA n=1 Tax=Staphylococcus TaxID=1279 RepID=UPI000DFF4BBB|nr:MULTISPECIES: hypothiocyanous acid reductase MerA [Staphylococcus]MBO1205965.1 FAD-containing oxidoreductase [Staphylococcus nepalensis]MBO1221798.1 FAD-containing oxidoreductase [Staphylococcus nepalensis]MCD8892425.1 FAD-containing oxidoreductase [Staphylococcus nepalensis]MDR5649634.1 hypothiocyanous acid reductase MerA [Staphylococcus nepalensis]MDW8553032.1 hypothiocyanous acid reductase MerA [Staphylococcus nepalensis]